MPPPGPRPASQWLVDLCCHGYSRRNRTEPVSHEASDESKQRSLRPDASRGPDEVSPHRPPPRIRLSLSAAPCHSCFERSGLFVCLEAQRLIACVGLRPPPRRLILTWAVISRLPRQLGACLLKGTLPQEIMERFCVHLSGWNVRTNRDKTPRPPGSNPSSDPRFPHCFTRRPAFSSVLVSAWTLME